MEEHEHGTREGHAKPRPHQLVQGAETERSERDMPQVLLAQRAVELERHADPRPGANRGEQANRCTIEPTEGERQQFA